MRAGRESNIINSPDSLEEDRQIYSEGEMY